MNKIKLFYFIIAVLIMIIFMENDVRSQPVMSWVDVGLKQSPYIRNLNGKKTGVGRIDYIAFDPNNQNIVFACSPWGGLFKSTDKGLNWESVGLEFKVNQPATSCMYIDPYDVTSSTWYIGSGNSDGPHRSAYQRESEGVYRTLNKGATWVNIGPFIKGDCDPSYIHDAYEFPLKCGYLINDIIKGHESREHLIISTTCGIYETTQAINLPAWSKLISGNFGSVVAQPGNERSVFCAENLVDNPRIYRIIYRYNGAREVSEIDYSSTGINITSQTVRVVLRFSKNPAYSDNLFIFFNGYNKSDLNKTQAYIYKISSGIFINKGIVYMSNFNRHDAVHISDDDANIIYMADKIYTPRVSTNGLDNNPLTFTTLSTTYVHVDQHHITQSPHDESVWVANDGGVYELVSGAFQERLNGLAVSTIDAFDIAQIDNETRYVAGYQDMGCQVTDFDINANNEFSVHYVGCDGHATYFDPKDFNIFSGRCNYNNMSFFTQDPSTKEVSSKNSTNFMDVVSDKNASGVVYNLNVTEKKLYKSTDWGKNSTIWCPYNNLRSYAISPSNSDIMYCVSYDFINNKAVIYKSVTGGGNSTSYWETILYANNNFEASRIIVDYDNPHHLWVIAGYPTALYSLNTLNLTLTDFSNKTNTPFPTWDAVQLATVENEYNSNQGIYVVMENHHHGSDVYTYGVYYTDLTLDRWVEISDGLPNIRVRGVKVNQKSQELYAATYGRGMWKSPLYCSASSGSRSITNYLTNQSYFYDNTITINSTVGGLVSLRAGNEIVFNPGFETSNGADFVAIARSCGSAGGLKSTIKDNQDIRSNGESITSGTEINHSWISIHPNPTSGILTIEPSKIIDKPVEIEVYNIYGTLLRETSFSQSGFNLDLTDLPSGIYLMKLSDGNRVISERIVKK